VLEKSLLIPALLRLLGAAFGRRPIEMWIGDSHAMSSNRAIVSGAFLTGADGVLIVRVGARLMFSLAVRGFPAWSRCFAWLAGRLCRPGQIRPIFMAGEIDVRVHLVEHAHQGLGFVSDYAGRCRGLARLLRAEQFVLAVPPPPCDMTGFRVWYPVIGSLEERITVWQMLRDAIVDAAHAVGAQVLDFSGDVAGPDGSLRPELSDDGAHTNQAAIPLIRAAVSRLGYQPST
jgi:hypothetical protein